MIEEGIAKDLSMVVENAKLMGCRLSHLDIYH